MRSFALGAALVFALLMLVVPAHAGFSSSPINPPLLEADHAVCTTLNEDPEASYLVKVGSTTVYDGDSMGSMFSAVSANLTESGLTLTVDSDGKAAMLAYHNCTTGLTEQAFVHGVMLWANTGGGVAWWETDMQIETGGTTKDYEFAVFDPETVWDDFGTSTIITDRPIFKLDYVSMGTDCDSQMLPGVYIFGDQPVVSLYAWRPARKGDPDLKLQSCSGNPCASCQLFWNTENDELGNAHSFYSCGCRNLAMSGNKCNYNGPGRDYPPSPYTDGDGDGDGDGGIWNL